jgi:uncharacterized protein YyaL (SSP411 family)
MAADGLMRLAALTGEQRYRNHADRILQLLGTIAMNNVGAASNAALAMETRARGISELAIVGDAPDLVRVAQVIWRPDLVLAWGEPFDSPLWENRREGYAYLCRDFACQSPVSEPDDLYERLTGQRPPSTTSRRGG